MNDSERWDQLKALFEEALSLPTGARVAFLDRIDDAAQRDEVRSLLDALDADPSFLEEPIATDTLYHAVDDQGRDALGDRIGPYRLVRVIGSGGMGTVYLAERSDGQFSQQVALKLSRPGELHPDRLAHLYHERQILASLQHPNIARLYDGGVTPDGRPFLAMEYVQGLPIDRYCDRHMIDLSGRIDLFRAVCAAVQHAHQNLVIHRDLKPSNILVDESGQVKLLDFGIAKLLSDSSGDEARPATRTGAHLMTLAYASPEQVSGRPITTASDVYTLGVLVYELLAGVRPYDLAALSPTQIEAAICRQDPPRPSTRAELSERTRRRLRGDLDLIVMNALRKEPERRYPSPAHLSEDLLRFTQRQPIAARPNSLRYRVSTFVRRHRAAVLTTSLVLIALVAGLLATWRLAYEADLARDHAERRFNDVRSLANTLLFDFHDAIRDLPGATPARRLLVASARVYLDSLLQESASDPQLQAELAEAYLRVGEIEGDPHFPNLGDLAAAEASYRESVRLNEEQLATHPEDAATRHTLAGSLGRLAVVQSWGGANNDAIASSERALGLLDELAASNPENESIRRDAGRIRSELGWWMIWAGRIGEGLVHLDSAEARLREAFHRDPDQVDTGIDLWRAVAYRVDGLSWSDAKKEALALLSDAGCPLLEDLDRRHPDHPRILSSLKTCLHKRGNLAIELGQTDVGLDAFRRSLALAEALARSDSTNIQGLRGVAVVHESLGSAYRSLGEPGRAVDHFERALALKETLYALDPDHAEAGNTLANTRRSLCVFHVESGRPDRALPFCLAALDLLRATVVADPGNAIARESLALTYVETARTYFALSRQLLEGEQPERHLAEAIQLYDLALGEIDRLAGVDFSWSIPPEVVKAERAALLR